MTSEQEPDHTATANGAQVRREPDRPNPPRVRDYAGAYLLGVLVGTPIAAITQPLSGYLAIPEWELVVLAYYSVAAVVTILIMMASGNRLGTTIAAWIRSRSKAFQLLPTVTLLAAFLYLLLRSCYVAFYEPMHLSPEEVGLDYRAILQLSAATIAVLAICTLAGTIVLLIGMLTAAYLTWAGFHAIVGRDVWDWTYRRLTSAAHSDVRILSIPARLLLAVNRAVDSVATNVLLPKELASPASSAMKSFISIVVRSAGRMILWLLVASLPFAGAFLQYTWIRSSTFAALAMSGTEVRPLSYAGFEILSVSAEPANVTFLQGSQPVPVRIQQCMYLGKDSSDIILFDVDHQRLIRLPAASVVVESSARTDEPCL